MRETKYRVWNKIYKLMYPVLEINFEDKEVIYQRGASSNCGCCSDDNDHFLNFKDCVLMQFTGLKDKECKEIYEGDIMLNEDGVGDIWICEFNEGMFVYRLPLENGDEIIPINEPKGFKVVGNIYKNPELLK